MGKGNFLLEWSFLDTLQFLSGCVLVSYSFVTHGLKAVGNSGMYGKSVI